MNIITTCLTTTADYRVLALYSHLIPAAAILILGLFAFLYAEHRGKAGAFFAFSTIFTLWLGNDLANWLLNDYHLVAATWAPLDAIEIAAFLCLFIFAIVDQYPDISRRTIWLVSVPALPLFVLTLIGHSVGDMNQPQCEMLDAPFIAPYKFWLEAIIVAAVFLLGIYRMWTANDRRERVRTWLVTSSITLFMGVFAGAEYYSTQTGVYEVTLYSLFALPLFILVIAIAITSFQTFRLGNAAIRMLFYLFVILAGTQFFSINDMFDFGLTCISFAVVIVLGLLLLRATESEQRQREIAERLSAEKSEFMAFASHEIRNPITAMRGYASMIADGTTGSTHKETLSAARQVLLTGDEVLMLISQFLDKSKVELGQITYDEAPFDFGAALSSVADGFRPHVEERGLSLHKDIDLSQHYSVRGDQGKVKEVLGNLIDNSLKYTRQGSITVSVQREGERVRAIVKDTGVGIPADVLPKLFQKFGRADAQKANLLGTGLGLYIARVFIEGMGGRVWAESEGAGKGARFIVELPAA